jgi:hypothetical protein
LWKGKVADAKITNLKSHQLGKLLTLEAKGEARNITAKDRGKRISSITF